MTENVEYLCWEELQYFGFLYECHVFVQIEFSFAANRSCFFSKLIFYDEDVVGSIVRQHTAEYQYVLLLQHDQLAFK